ncbi:MAG: hypothetical protein AAF907_00630 [Planctomycetota bacterium]
MNEEKREAEPEEPAPVPPQLSFKARGPAAAGSRFSRGDEGRRIARFLQIVAALLYLMTFAALAASIFGSEPGYFFASLSMLAGGVALNALSVALEAVVHLAERADERQ